MCNTMLRALACALLLGAADAVHAESTLQGLEMDVMEPGESAAHATARIVLPRPRNGIERSADYPGLDTEQRVQLGAPDAGDRMGITGGEVGAPSSGPADGALEPDVGATPEDPSGEPGG